MTIEIGKEPHFYGDYFFYEEALPNATSKTSEEFDCGNTQAGLRVAAYAVKGVTVAESKVLTITIEGSDDKSDWTPIDTSTLTGAETSGTVIAAGEALTSTVLDTKKKYVRVKVTTDSDLSAGTITVAMEYIPR